METILTSSTLQWGAFGLLAAVLTGVGFYLRSYLDRLMTQQMTLNESHLESSKEQTAFLRTLVSQEQVATEARLSEWKGLVQADIQAKQELASVLQGLSREIASHEERAQQRHLALLAVLNPTEGVEK